MFIYLVDIWLYNATKWSLFYLQLSAEDALNSFLYVQVDSPGVYLQNGNRMLRIYRVQPEHAGRFSCTAQNSAGEARREYNIVVQGKLINQLSHWYLVLIRIE